MQHPEALIPSGQSRGKAALAPPEPGLPLRHDEVVSASFLLQVTLALIVLLGGLTLVLKWLRARGYGASLGAREKQTNVRLQILGRLGISAKTRVTLIEIDGRAAVITENQQNAVLQFLPLPPAVRASDDGDETTLETVP